MTCVVCSGTSDIIVWRENGYEGRACQCGTVYTSPEPLPGAVDPAYDAHPETFYASYALFKARWLKRILPFGRLLEVGCGDGHFLTAAKSLGYRVTGLEANPRRAAAVAERLGIEVRSALIEEVEWPEARFDVIYHCDLLSHFPDPLLALEKMKGLLAPNGVLAFEAGTLGGVDPIWYKWVEVIGYPQHRWLYSEEALWTLLSRAGLLIEQKRHFGLAPAVGLYRGRVALGRLARKVIPRKPIAQSGPAIESHANADGGNYQRLEQFVRYRIGAFAPRCGPGTWLIAARLRLNCPK